MRGAGARHTCSPQHHQTDHVQKDTSSACTCHKIQLAAGYLHREMGGRGRTPHPPRSRLQAAQTTDPGVGTPLAGPLPLRPAPGLPSWPGSEFPQLEEDHSFSLPPNTLDISKAVPSFRSHIKSASFLLRQRDLPAKQAAGTHVFVTQRLPLKRAGVNHGGLIVSAAGPVEGIRVNADGAARPIPARPAPSPHRHIPPLLIDSTPSPGPPNGKPDRTAVLHGEPSNSFPENTVPLGAREQFPPGPRIWLRLALAGNAESRALPR